MATTAARLLAEVGIDRSEFTTGLKKVREDLLDLADLVVQANRQIEATNKAVIASDNAVTASREKALSASDQYLLAQNALTKALLTQEEAVATVAAITSDLNNLNAEAEGYAKELTKLTLQLAAAKRKEELANIDLESALIRVDAAKRNEVKVNTQLQESIQGVAVAETERARATEVAAQRQAELQEMAVQANRELFLQNELIQAEAYSASELALKFKASQLEMAAMASAPMRMAILEGFAPQVAAMEAQWRQAQTNMRRESQMWSTQTSKSFQREAKKGPIDETLTPQVFQQLNPELVEHIATVARLQDAYDNAWGTKTAVKLRNFAAGVNDAGTKLKHFGTSASFAATVPIAVIGTMAFESAVKLDKWKTTLNTAMKEAGKNTQPVLDKFNQLYDLAKLPGLTLEDTMQSYSRFRATGLGDKDSIVALREFGNQLGLVNATADQTKRVFNDVVKMMSTATFNGREFLILSQQMPTFLSQFRKIFGEGATTESVAKLGLSGKQVAMMLANSWEGTQRAAESTQNSIKRIQQEFLKLGATVGDEIIPIFNEATPIITNDLKAMVDAFKGMSPENRKATIELLALAATAGPIAYMGSALLKLGSFGLNALGGLFKIGSQVVYMFQAMRAGASAASAANLVFGAGVTAAAARLTIYGAALAYAVYMIRLMNKSQSEIAADNHWGIDMGQINSKMLAGYTKKTVDATSAVALVAQYKEIAASHMNAEEKAAKLRLVYDKINALNPQLTRGYTAMGLQIGLVADATERAARAQEHWNGLQNKQQVTTDSYTKSNEIVAQIRDAKAALDELRTKGLARPKPAGLVEKPFSGIMSLPESADQKAQRENVFVHSGPAYNRKEQELLMQLESAQAALRANNAEMKAAYDAAAKKKIGGDSGLPATVSKADIENAKEWKKEVKDIARTFGLKVSSEYRAGATTHASGAVSDHARSLGSVKGLAVDFAGTKKDMADFFDYVRKTYGDNIKQLLYSPKGEVINGHYRSSIQNPITREDHYSHVHVALKNPVGNEDGLPDVIEARKQAKKDAKETMKALSDGEQAIKDLKSKRAELYASLASSYKLTDTEKLALEYAKEDPKKLGKKKQDPELTPAQITATTVALMKQNLELSAMNDLHQKLDKAQEKFLTQQRDLSMAVMTERKRTAVEAFGPENYFGRDSQDPRMKAAFNRTANASYQLQDQKALKDAIAATSEMTVSGRDDASEYAKALRDISVADKYWFENMLPIPAELQKMNAEVLKHAAALDKVARFKDYNDINKPLARSSQLALGWRAGNVNTRQNAIDDFTTQHKKQLDDMRSRGDGLQADNTIKAFADSWDLEDKNKQLAEIYKSMFDISHTAELLQTKDPFEKWVKGHETFDATKNKVVNPLVEATGGNQNLLHNMFNMDQVSQSATKMDSIQESMAKIKAESSANNPFDAWLVQYEVFDAKLNKFVLPPTMNKGFLAKAFDFERTSQLLKNFADNTADQLTNMFSQIANGAKISWSSVGRQFEVMLFKMATDMANAQIKQGLNSWFSKAAGQSPVSSGAALGAATTQFQAAVVQFQAAVTQMAASGMGGIGGLSGIGAGGGGVPDLSGVGTIGPGASFLPTVNARMIGAGAQMKQTATPLYGVGGSNVGAGNTNVSHAVGDTVTNNFHYHIHGRDDKTIRNTVTQSVQDLSRVQASTNKRVG